MLRRYPVIIGDGQSNPKAIYGAVPFWVRPICVTLQIGRQEPLHNLHQMGLANH